MKRKLVELFKLFLGTSSLVGTVVLKREMTKEDRGEEYL
jgi:hypothetical protein